MTVLEELENAIHELNLLWQVCADANQCEMILEKRDELDTQASSLANKILEEGSQPLEDAIDALKLLSKEAKIAKNEVNSIQEKINKTANVIDKATKAIGKVALLL